MRIPYTKAHGARNDFLLTWAHEAPRENLEEAARALCDRYGGVGADGWVLVSPSHRGEADWDASIRLFNSDGSGAEISGNGTRCAAAFLLDAGLGGEAVRIGTGAGLKELKLLERRGLRFLFEMNMGTPDYRQEELRTPLPLSEGVREVAIVHPGNPQCVVPVEDFSLDWRRLGAEIEGHPRFPHRTNVSFVRVVDEHTLEVRFYERGAGVTLSSGTGSTGAVAACVLLGRVRSPVRVLTLAGPLDLRWDGDIYLTGPAEIVAGGEFYFMEG